MGLQQPQKPWIGYRGLAPEELQVAARRVGLHTMAACVVHPQQAVGRQLHIQVGAGDNQPRDIAVLVPLPDASGKLARLVVTQHHAVPGVGRKDLVLAYGKSRHPSLLAGRVPNRHPLAAAVEHFHMIFHPGIDRPVGCDC